MTDAHKEFDKWWDKRTDGGKKPLEWPHLLQEAFVAGYKVGGESIESIRSGAEE